MEWVIELVRPDSLDFQHERDGPSIPAELSPVLNWSDATTSAFRGFCVPCMFHGFLPGRPPDLE